MPMPVSPASVTRVGGRINSRAAGLAVYAGVDGTTQQQPTAAVGADGRPAGTPVVKERVLVAFPGTVAAGVFATQLFKVLVGDQRWYRYVNAGMVAAIRRLLIWLVNRAETLRPVGRTPVFACCRHTPVSWDRRRN